MPDTTETDLSRYYVWFDSEFSSLDMERSRLLQVAMVVTDHSLQRVAGSDKDVNLCIELPEGERCDPWVEENLAALLAKCRSTDAVSVEEADHIRQAWELLKTTAECFTAACERGMYREN